MRPVETADRATGSRRRRYEGGEWRRTLYRPTMGSHDEVSVRSEEEEDARARNASGGGAEAHRQRICDLGGDLDEFWSAHPDPPKITAATPALPAQPAGASALDTLISLPFSAPRTSPRITMGMGRPARRRRRRRPREE